MDAHNDNTPDEEAREESDDTAFHFWSEEDAKRYNDALDEGGAYARARGPVSYDPEDNLYEQDCEYRDPELCEPDEETLPPGEMELIFENSYIM